MHQKGIWLKGVENKYIKTKKPYILYRYFCWNL